MPTLKKYDTNTTTWTHVVIGAKGDAGPTAVSSDAGNLAVLGTDNNILVNAARVTPAAIGAESVQTAASQTESETGTETALRSWSPVRVWQAIAAKVTTMLASGIAPYLTSYTQAGVADASAYLSGSTLTLPWGRVCCYLLSTQNITLATAAPPTAPVCARTVLVLKQVASGTMRAITAYPTSQWPYSIAIAMPQTYGARLKIIFEVMPDGVVDITAMQMGTPE